MLSVLHRARRQCAAGRPFLKSHFSHVLKTGQPLLRGAILGASTRLKEIRRPEAKLRGICFSKLRTEAEKGPAACPSLLEPREAAGKP